MKEDEITKMYLSSRNLNFLFLVKTAQSRNYAQSRKGII